MINAFRILVCLLSVVLLAALGAIGQNLVDLTAASLQASDVQLPVVVQSFLNHFSGAFPYTLGPVMILLLALAFFSYLLESIARLFWYLFVSIWLLVALYLSAFSLMLLFPFHILMSRTGHNPIRTFFWFGDLLLVSAVIVALILVFRRRRRSPAPDPPSTHS